MYVICQKKQYSCFDFRVCAKLVLLKFSGVELRIIVNYCVV